MQCQKNRFRVNAYIDLGAVRHNAEQVLNMIADDCLMIAVVKADGYGFGAVPIAGELEKIQRIWGFAVATTEEAVELRQNGIKKPVLILGYTVGEDADIICRYGIIPTVFCLKDAEILSAAAERSHSAVDIHIALDTGMSRIGYNDIKEAVEECRKIQSLPNINLKGVFTHFARADESDRSNVKQQYRRFQEFCSALSNAGISADFLHCSNSAGVMSLPEANLNAVRAGIVLYGIYPSSAANMHSMDLQPVIKVTSQVVHVKMVKKGIPIGYGGTFITNRQSKIATVSVGYADGYPRSLSNKGYVLIHGQRAPVCGRVCMDQMMIDVTDVLPAVKTGDEVILLGRSEDEEITVEMLAEYSGRFHYEVVCCMTRRVHKFYYNSLFPVVRNKRVL